MSWPLRIVSTLSKGVGYAPEALALFARFTTPPTTQRKGQINTLIKALKAGNLWAKLDALYLMAAADSQAARRNWIADQYNLTPVSAPTFTADLGYTGDGVNSYLATGFVPSSAVSPKFVQDSATYGMWSRTAAAAASATDFDMGGTVSGSRADMRIRRPDNTIGYLVNDTTLVTAANTDGRGMFAAIRTGNSARSIRRNKTQLSTDAIASTGVPTSSLSILAGGIGSGRSARQASAGFIGSGLSGAESDALYDALLIYLQATGAA